MDKRRRDIIHRDAMRDDSDLPFKLGKPKKHVPRDVYHECSNCGLETFISRHTVMYVCRGCGKLEKINGKQ